MTGGTHVKVTLDKRLVNNMLYTVTDKSAKKAADITRDRARANLVAAGRVNTGKLLSSINVRKVSSVGPVTTYSVGTSVPYAGYQERGIGPVHARPGGVLRFKPKGMGSFIFRPRTKGFPGAYFMRNAYRSLTLRDYL